MTLKDSHISPPSNQTDQTNQTELPNAHQSLVNRVQELDALLEIGKTVTALLDVDAILRKVVGEAVNLTHAEESMLLLIDQTTNDLYLRAQQNIGESVAKNFKMKMSDSVAGQVVQTGEPILINTADIKLKTGFIVKSLINVPLISGHDVIGVLAVSNRKKDDGFNQNHVRVMQALADWAAIAIANARLHRETQRGSKSMELINEISRSILSSLHIEEIPHKLIQQTTEILGAECGSLVLVDQKTQELEFKLAYDGRGQEITQMRGLRLPLGQGIIGLVAADGQPRIVINAQENEQWYPKVDTLTQFTTEEVLAVPLQTEGKIIGVVELLNKRDGHFTQDDQELLMAVASAAAIAIQNAQQYDDLQQTHQELEDAHQELEEAQRQKIASEQWSILGRAALVLAHRIHNTTAIVPASAQDLREVLAPIKLPPTVQVDVDANLARIERNTIYTLDLADSLLKYFRQEPEAASEVNPLVEAAIKQIELPTSVALIQDLAPNLPAVDISNLLTEAVLELMSNAVNAMPEGGTLTVRTETVHEFVCVSIQDTGTGIPEEQQTEIFTLFYGRDTKGLGFGLWWVKTFLQQYRGDIVLESALGKGTMFIIRLPISGKKG